MSWVPYFIQIAKEVSSKSKDPSSKVGCVIADEKHRPVSFGFNGFVAGCDESKLSWTEKNKKYATVIHAEMNAIIFANRKDLSGCVAYITHSPCESCLKHMLQAGIREIHYEDVSIVRDRGSEDGKWAIKALIEATGAKVTSTCGIDYVTHLGLG